MNINDLEMDSIKRIGLDKLKLSGFAVANMDIAKLLSIAETGTVEVHTAVSASRVCKRFLPGTKTGITKIAVKDNEIFSDLVIGCADGHNNFPIEYVYLTITVANAKGFNLENMSYEEYTQYISLVLEYIHSEYGIELYADYMKVDYLEINANIFLTQDFPKYHRVLKLLMSFFSNHFKKLSTYERLDKGQADAESYKRGNKSIEVVFYDKLQQLRDSGTYLEEDISILRIELRLKEKKKVKYAFGSCFWKDLNDKKIAEYFTAQIYTQLLKKYNVWHMKKEKELKKLIVSCRERSSKVWHHLLMQEIRNKSEKDMLPFILDMEQICSSFRLLPDKHRNRNRAINSLLNISIEDDSYKNNDIEKVYEILDTLKHYSETV